MNVIGFKSVEELYPSPPLGVDSADTSQLPKEKNLHGHFQYFQITQPGSSTVIQCLATCRKEIILRKSKKKAELEKSEGDCDKDKQQVTPFNKSSGTAARFF